MTTFPSPAWPFEPKATTLTETRPFLWSLNPRDRVATGPWYPSIVLCHPKPPPKDLLPQTSTNQTNTQTITKPTSKATQTPSNYRRAKPTTHDPQPMVSKAHHWRPRQVKQKPRNGKSSSRHCCHRLPTPAAVVPCLCCHCSLQAYEPREIEKKLIEKKLCCG